MRDFKTLDVRGVGLALQLEGTIQILLTPNGICYELCATREVILHAGQAFLFNTNMWQFAYRTIAESHANMTITFLQEIGWFN